MVSFHPAEAPLALGSAEVPGRKKQKKTKKTKKTLEMLRISSILHGAAAVYINCIIATMM